jgi:hypothetical protein
MRSRWRTARTVSRLVAAFALVAAVAAGTGCSIWEEIDGADKKMDEARRGGAPAPTAPPASEAAPAKPGQKPEPGLMDRAFAWSKKATTPAPKPHDPKDPIVKCKRGNGLTFVYKLDCENQGGLVVGG